MKFPLEGTCQCGNVRVRLLSAPSMIVACHCKECQKLSTSAFSITAMVDAAEVEFSGTMQDWSRTAESGNISAAKFCPKCGNRIYHYNPAKPEQIKLKPALLENTALIQPSAHIWVSEKQDWFELPEGVKTFEKQPG